MINYVIYKIECTKNGRVYIGQSKNYQKRWNEHKNKLRSGIHHSVKLQRAWIKYGEENFNYSILALCDANKADETEVYWIKNYDSTNKLKGFNNDSGGNANKTLSNETRKKLSEAHKKRYKVASTYLNSPEAMEKKRKAMSGENNPMFGKKVSRKTRIKMSESHKGKLLGSNNPMFGKPVSDERKSLYSDLFTGMGNPFFGRNHTDESKEKIRALATGRTHGESARTKMSLKRQGKDNPAARSVVCVTTGKSFSTIKEASLFYEVHPNGISMCCCGKRVHGGRLPDGTLLSWKYQ